MQHLKSFEPITQNIKTIPTSHKITQIIPPLYISNLIYRASEPKN